jgi:RNA polymerase sigma factor (sigma-70 family)
MTDGERFAEAVSPLVPQMLRAAVALLGPVDGEDAAQEAITRAWQARAALRNQDALRPWLLRITINVCRQWHRGRFGTHQRLTEPLPDESDGDASGVLALLGADPGASDAAALDLRQAVNALPDDLRLVVVLRFYGGMDGTEISAAMSIPAGTVRTRLKRALSILRDELHDATEAYERALTGDAGEGSHV